MQIILIFLTITIFTGLIVSSVNYIESKNFLDNQLNRELDNTGNLIKKNIEDKLEEVGSQVSNITNKPEFKNYDRPEMQKTMEHFLEFSDMSFNVYVYNKTGYLIGAAYFDKRPYITYLGENFNNYKNVFTIYANKVFQDGKARFTDTFHSKQKRLMITYISPITDKANKDVIGIVSCGIYVYNKKLEKILERLKPPYDGFICLLDQKGNMMGYGGNIPEDFNKTKIESLLNLNKEQDIFKINNEEFRYKLNNVDVANIYILVAVPNKVVTEVLKVYTVNIVIYTILAMLLSIIISIFIANLIVRPISILVEGLKEVGNGNYTYRIEFKSTGEIERAVNAFNEMTGKLQKNKIIEKIWIENWK